MELLAQELIYPNIHGIISGYWSIGQEK